MQVVQQESADQVRLAHHILTIFLKALMQLVQPIQPHHAVGTACCGPALELHKVCAEHLLL